MILFPGMLVNSAEAAGMAVPPDPEDFNSDEYPHFDVFCKAQLARSMDWDEPHDNAVIIASIPAETIRSVTFLDLLKMGFRIKGLYVEDLEKVST